MILPILIATNSGGTTGGGGTEPPPSSTGTLMTRHYKNGTRYNAWGCTSFPLLVSGVLQYHYYYSSATMHGGQATSRRLRYYADGTKIDDTEIWSDPDKSRRDFGGGAFIDGSGNQIHIVFYVEHDMTVTDPVDHDPIWGMLGMGFYKYVYNAAGVLQTFNDYPDSFDTSTEPDYANYGNLVRHPFTGRLYHMAYGTSGTGRGLLYISDDDGDTWTLHAQFGFISSDSEGALAYLAGTTNSDATLAYFVRNDSGKPDLWISTNGGTTFPFYEQLAWASPNWKALWAFIRPDNGNVAIMGSSRDAQNYMVRAAEFDTEILASAVAGVTNTALLSNRVIWPSMINSRPFESSNMPGNYGYATIGLPPEGHADESDASKWPVTIYDMSPDATDFGSSAFDETQTDHIITPYEDQARVKAYSNVNQTLPNGSTKLIFGDAVIDTLGEWNPVTSRWTCKKAGSRTISINTPRTNNNGASITAEARKYLAATPTTLDSVIGTYTEADGLSGTVGKLQFYFTDTFAVGDVVDFYAVTSGATSSPQTQNQNSPQQLTAGGGGVYYGVDITDAQPLTDGVKVKVAASAQSFSNTVAGVITGTEVQDTHNAFSAGSFVVPVTGWYRFKIKIEVDNATSPRSIIEVSNFEVGQEGQNVRKKILRQIENRNRGGASTITDDLFYHLLYQNETVKVLYTPYGAGATTLAGSFNTIEIEQV